MKKILIFSLAYYPKHVGGAEVAIKEITNRVDPKEIEFHMVTLRFDSTLPKVEKVGNVLVHRVGFAVKNADIARTHHPLFYITKIFFVPLAALRAIRLDRKYRFDGLWAMMAYMTFPIMLMRSVGATIPYALTLQEGDPVERVFERWYIKIFNSVLSAGFKRATIIQTISTFLAKWAKQRGFKGNAQVIPNGVDTKHFSQEYSKEELDAIKQKIGKKDNEIWLIHTGRYVTKNGLEDVIRALPLLAKHLHLFMIGDGPQAQMYKDLAESLGVSGRVHFHPYVPVDEIPKYLKACDIFIRPSLSEGMGNSFVEAMAVGLPVIATQEGGIADFLFDPDRNPNKDPTGLAVGVHDPEGIARQVKRYIDDNVLRESIVKNARELAFAKYDWDLIAHDMKEKVFDKLFGSR